MTTYLPWIDIYEGISLLFSAAASEWAGWALAHPEFGSSVNPITTRGGADYAHHITASPPGFENPVASLQNITAFETYVAGVS